MGGLNLAVNCAGVGWPKRMVGKDGPMPGDFFRKVIEINLVGTLLVCKAAAAEIQKNTPNADGERGVASQMAVFASVTRDLPGERSVCNSAATLRHSELASDWVRPGIAMRSRTACA